jgi:hypothetical protein
MMNFRGHAREQWLRTAAGTFDSTARVEACVARERALVSCWPVYLC